MNAPFQLDRAFLLNRMMFAIASRVRALVHEVSGLQIREVSGVDALPRGAGGLLVIGRQHLIEEGGVRYGHEVVEDAVHRLRPRALIYVLPGDYEEHKYDRDLAALEQVLPFVPVYVLEFASMRRLGEAAAAARARSVLADEDRGAIHWLFSSGPELARESSRARSIG